MRRLLRLFDRLQTGNCVIPECFLHNISVFSTLSYLCTSRCSGYSLQSCTWRGLKCFCNVSRIYVVKCGESCNPLVEKELSLASPVHNENPAAPSGIGRISTCMSRASALETRSKYRGSSLRENTF